MVSMCTPWTFSKYDLLKKPFYANENSWIRNVYKCKQWCDFGKEDSINMMKEYTSIRKCNVRFEQGSPYFAETLIPEGM